MKVAIYTIQKTLFEGEAEKLIAQTTLGEITVLENHLPLISTLEGSSVKIVNKNREEVKINILSGFLEVRPESEVVIIAEQ
jgi:F-type H+-transporting ATPase subunit epsilon